MKVLPYSGATVSPRQPQMYIPPSLGEADIAIQPSRRPVLLNEPETVQNTVHPPRISATTPVRIPASADHMPLWSKGLILALTAIAIYAHVLRLIRARKKERSEALRESRDQSLREEKALQTRLYCACAAFCHAASRHNQYKELHFRSVGECVALIPNLVHSWDLKAEHARLLESNVPHLTVAAGSLRTKTDERERAAYLDSTPMTPSLSSFAASKPNDPSSN